MVFTLPLVILMSLVILVPLAQAIAYSFTDWNGSSAAWVGVDNFVRVITDPGLQRSAANSVILLLSVPIGMIFPFVTAYALSNGMPGGPFFKAAIFAPTALSWVVIGLVARSAVSINGPLNSFLRTIGLGDIALNWLAEPEWAMVAVVVTFNAAVFGVNTIIFLTGFSTIDRSMIEAARIDGANAPRILWSIILPASRRFVEFVFTITVVLSFTGLFGLIYVMTAGGPGSATTTLEFAVWDRAFGSGDFGLAAALGVILMALTLTVLLVTRLLTRRKREEG